MAEANEINGNRSAAEIRQDIAAKRESISDAFGQLGAKIHGKLDWRSYVARHPYAAVGLAAGTGLLVSGVFRRRRSPAEQIADALADMVHGFANDARKSVSRIVVKAGAPIVLKSAVKVALADVLSQASSTAGSRLRAAETAALHQTFLAVNHRFPPGFPEEVRQTRVFQENVRWRPIP